MDLEDAIATFEAVTGGTRSVAIHLLDAYGGDVNAAVAYYLESGGVGHGNGMHSPPDLELPEALVQPARPSNMAANQPESPIEVRAGADGGRRVSLFQRVQESLPASLQILDEDDDDGIQVLATSLGRRRAAQRMDDLVAGGCCVSAMTPGAGWACPPSTLGGGDGQVGVRGQSTAW